MKNNSIMRGFLKGFLIAFVYLVLFYASLSFILNEWNPTLWIQKNRAMLIFFTFCISLIHIGALSVIDESRKEKENDLKENK